MSSSFSSSAATCNPSLAWTMGNGGKGFITIKFPFTLDSGWYQELCCTEFRTFQHRKERKGLRHEFIVLKLLDGSACRIERMGDPNARMNALMTQGSVAQDIIQCFGPKDLDQAQLTSSEIVAEITLPCKFDLMDVLKICRAIHEGERTLRYTLRVYNCYFFSLAIQVCLTRLIAQWEDKEFLGVWLSWVSEAIEALPDTDPTLATCDPPHKRPVLYRIYSLLTSCHDYQKISFAGEIKSRLRPHVTCSEKVQQDLISRINNQLWHSTASSSLREFIEEKVRDVVISIFQERPSNFGSTNAISSSIEPLEKLKYETLLVFVKLMALASINARMAAPLPRSLKRKSVVGTLSKAKVTTMSFNAPGKQSPKISNASESRPCYQSQQIIHYILCLGSIILWAAHTILDLCGITLFKGNPIPCLIIEQKLDYTMNALECSDFIKDTDLEYLLNEMHALSGNQAAAGLKSTPVSIFQDHILERIKIQAIEVEGFWLGSASKIQVELEDALTQVWRLIREVDVHMLDSGYYLVPQGQPTNPPDGEGDKISTEVPPIPTPEETPPVDELELAQLIPPIVGGSPSRTPSSLLVVEPSSSLSTFTEARGPHSHKRGAESRQQTPAKLKGSHWELRPKGAQTWVECLNEWSDKFGARLDWHCSISQGSAQIWRAVPIINGEEMASYAGEGGSRDAAMNSAALTLNRNHVLWRRN